MDVDRDLSQLNRAIAACLREDGSMDWEKLEELAPWPGPEVRDLRFEPRLPAEPEWMAYERAWGTDDNHFGSGRTSRFVAAPPP